MLQIKDLSITHRQDLRTILSDFSFVLNRGDKAVIIGEEGNGKSTLLKLIYNPELVEDYIEWSGDISGNDRPGYLAQELSSDELQMSAEDFLFTEPGFWSLVGKERAALAAQLSLDMSVFSSERLMESFSGGERVKLQLARLLASEPDYLLLDEPSNDLDLDALEWLEDYIANCNLPVLFVSHDETLIEKTANVVIHLELLRRKALPRATIARLPYREYIDARISKFSHQETVAKKQREDLSNKLERYRRIRQKVEHQQNTITRQDAHGGQLLKKKMHAVQSMGRRFEKEKEKFTALPEVEEAVFLSFPKDTAIPNGKTVLDYSISELTVAERVLAHDIALRVTGPEKICIIGSNGSGKTTLLREITAELLSRSDVRAAYMPQNYSELLDMTKTPLEFLNHSGSRQEETLIRNHLGSLRYTSEEMTHAIGEMSGGQKAKLLFVKLVLEGANVLILDEPTRNFSPLSNPVIRRILCDFPGAIISVSHDRKYIADVCDTVYALGEDGLTKI